MTTPARYRKRPVEVDAIQWTGDNLIEVQAFTGAENFRTVRSAPRAAAVYDVLHITWIALVAGDWIIRGVRGELYPCKAAVFVETYEQVTP